MKNSSTFLCYMSCYITDNETHRYNREIYNHITVITSQAVDTLKKKHYLYTSIKSENREINNKAYMFIDHLTSKANTPLHFLRRTPVQ